MRLKSLAVAALLAASAAAPLAMGQQRSTPVVPTSLGKVSGMPERDSNAYLGIPFAKPPVGALRWKDPVKPAGWSGVRAASSYGANCYQDAPRRFGPYTPEFLIKLPVSEDCLYLNVWTPARPAKGPLPVLVWIHGGGFGSGSGSIPIYNGARLAAKGAVVVTVNYRLGVFGFLAHPGLTAESSHHSSGNYGLLDIIAALHWTKDNISAFGGDPERVTIAGQSAGAMAVNDLLMSPQAAGLFSSAIAESGSGSGVRMAPLKEAEKRGQDLAARLGAPSVADLRALSPDALLKAVAAPLPGSGGGRRPPGFTPTVDGRVLVSEPDDAASPKSNVPLLTGFNHDEGAGLKLDAQTSPAEFEAWVKGRYGALSGRFLKLYPHATAAEASQSANLLARDQIMANLTLWAEARTKASKQAIYPYRFDHPYPGPEAKQFGTFHTAEVPYVFGVLDQQGRPFTAADHAVSDQIQGYWLNFMRTGDPNGPGLPRWPAFGADGRRVMMLGDRVGPQPGVSSPERLEAFRAARKALGAPSFL